MAETEQFEFLGALGKGGMGTVYRARDRRTGDIVAIKELHAFFVDDPDYLARFEREVEVARRIASPHVVRVLGYGKRGNTPFMVMEYVEGRTLRELLDERKRLPWDEAKSILVQVTEGLRAAHMVGVIHRDVKSANILITRDGTVKLADFGVARATDLTRLTATGGMVGTPSYMAPENVTSPQSDLYGLGCVLYEMLSGHVPFSGASPQEVMLRHLRERPDLTDIPLPARPIVSALLQKAPQRRPASATALLLALEAEAPTRLRSAAPTRTAPTRAATAAEGEGGGPGARSQLGLLAAGAAALVALGALALVRPWDSGSPTPPAAATVSVAASATEDVAPTQRPTIPPAATSVAATQAAVTPAPPASVSPAAVSGGPVVLAKDWSTANARWGDRVVMRIDYQNGDAPLAKLQIHDTGVNKDGSPIVWDFFNWNGQPYQWTSDNYMVVPVTTAANATSHMDLSFNCVSPKVASSRMVITLIDARDRRSQDNLVISFICSQTGN